jgi:hypothetical protein
MRRTFSLAIALTISLALLVPLSTIKASAESNLSKTEEIIFRQMEVMRAGGTTIAGPGFVQLPPNQRERIFYTYTDSEMEVCVTVVSVSNAMVRISVGDSEDTTINPFRARSVCNSLGNVSNSREVKLLCPDNATSDCWAIWRVDKLSTIEPKTEPNTDQN